METVRFRIRSARIWKALQRQMRWLSLCFWEAFAEYFGKNMENVYGEVLKKHLEIGMLEQKGDRIYLSRKGIHVSNGVMADFLL